MSAFSPEADLLEEDRSVRKVPNRRRPQADILVLVQTKKAPDDAGALGGRDAANDQYFATTGA
jgi:hypothetical protein